MKKSLLILIGIFVLILPALADSRFNGEAKTDVLPNYGINNIYKKPTFKSQYAVTETNKIQQDNKKTDKDEKQEDKKPASVTNYQYDNTNYKYDKIKKYIQNNIDYSNTGQVFN